MNYKMKGDTNKKLSSLVREMRTFRGFSQQQLADESGLGKSTIVKIENEIANPGIKTIEIISEALKCELSIDIKPIEEER